MVLGFEGLDLKFRESTFREPTVRPSRAGFPGLGYQGVDEVAARCGLVDLHGQQGALQHLGLQGIADFYFNVEIQESLQNVADVFVNVEIKSRELATKKCGCVSQR